MWLWGWGKRLSCYPPLSLSYPLALQQQARAFEADAALQAAHPRAHLATRRLLLARQLINQVRNWIGLDGGWVARVSLCLVFSYDYLPLSLSFHTRPLTPSTNSTNTITPHDTDNDNRRWATPSRTCSSSRPSCV